MNLSFENDFQKKVMFQTFSEQTSLASKQDVMKWRAAWMQELGKWHSPYKLLLDVSNLTLEEGADGETEEALKTMVTFFKGFFLKSVIAFHKEGAPQKGFELLPFSVFDNEAAALEKAGLNRSLQRVPGDFRSAIQIQNHFRQHVMELTFAEDVKIETSEQMATLKSKITNNLMQWHSKWSLLVDCHNVEINPDLQPDFDKMFRFFQGFFMKKALGYSPKTPKTPYPFKVYRARHRAAAELEGEGNFSGDEANCASRKSPAD